MFVRFICTFTRLQYANRLLLPLPFVALSTSNAFFHHQRKPIAIPDNDATRSHQGNRWDLIIGRDKSNFWSLSMNDLALICPICKRKTMRQSYTNYCVCFRRKVHRNCTVLSPDEFAWARHNSHWYRRLCNENIPAFNHIENDSEFQQALHKFVTFLTLDLDINDDNDHIVEYDGELDPDKTYFNQFSYHLSQSSNYYSEDSVK